MDASGVFALSLLALISAAFFVSSGCGEEERTAQVASPEVERVLVLVDPQSEEGQLQERYLGFTFDTAQFVSDKVGGDEGWYYEKAYPPELESDRLRALAASLGPSILRIGGTDADGVYFCDREEGCELPETYRSAYPKGTNQRASYLTREDIRRIGEFAEAIDAEIMFCLNFGPGPRDRRTDAWADGNARQLVRYARSLSNGHRFAIWHFYPTQSENCGSGLFDRPFPSTAENLFNEEIVAKSRRYARYVRDAAGGLPVFLDETASAECGGQAGVSDTLLDALWSADWIGIIVQEGTRAIMRQTLLGFDYGIVDPGSHEPRPTLLALAAFRRFVARARLRTEVDRSILRAHAFCNPQRTNLVTTVLVNPGPKRLLAEICLDAPEILGAFQWTISSPAGLEGTRATIQGQSIDDAGHLPTPPGTPVHFENGTAFAAVTSESLAFVVLELRDTPGPCVD